MNQTIFQFRNKFCKQTFGTCMGNPLSCFIANLFMANLEWSLKDLPCFPSFWRRYVDDVLVIIDRKRINDLLLTINQQYQTIKRTKGQQTTIFGFDAL
jgi:hypothetical protein